MTDYGFKVSQPGYDVKTATIQQIAYTSQYPIFKAKYSGTLTLVMAASITSSVSFSHNLGYIPAFRCYGNPSTLSQQRLCDFASNFGSGNSCYIRARITTTQLIIYGDNTKASSQSTIIYYYIYSDSGY